MGVPVQQIVTDLLSKIAAAMAAPIPEAQLKNVYDGSQYAELLEEKMQRLGVATQLTAQISQDQFVTQAQLDYLTGLTEKPVHYTLQVQYQFGDMFGDFDDVTSDFDTQRFDTAVDAWQEALQRGGDDEDERYVIIVHYQDGTQDQSLIFVPAHTERLDDVQVPAAYKSF